MSENTMREIEGATGTLEFVVPLHSPHRMLVRVVNAHFPNAPSVMRWSLASSVRTRDQERSRMTFAGYPAKLRADAREDEINANSVPCVLDMALNTPWYNAIVLECESPGLEEGVKCEPGLGWFVDLVFDPYEPCAAAATAADTTAATEGTTPPPSTATAATHGTGASLTFPCPYCVAFAYAKEATLRRHIRNCHGPLVQ
jgi:hypothetical protein